MEEQRRLAIRARVDSRSRAGLAIVLSFASVATSCGGDPAIQDAGIGDGGIPSPEVCDNALDDDLDGAADCEDSDCRAPEPGLGPVDFAESVRFLWEGSSTGRCPGGPVQEGVADGALRADTVAVVRGRVVTSRGGTPVSGARISVAAAPDLGLVRSDGGGYFMIAVRGGAAVTVGVDAEGYLPLQRTVAAPPGRWGWAGTLALTSRDTAATVIRFGSDAAQIHRADVVTDDDGTRRATLVFPAGVRATVDRDGMRERPESLTIRATEYTVGERGPEAMPGNLPAASAYTYAVELDADEALGGNARIDLDRPVALLVENFLHFSVGSRVPLGYYDRGERRWIADDDGLVIAIVGHDETGARIDLDGDGDAESGDTVSARLGLRDAERRAIAGLYPDGTELWFSSVDHFTPWDCNWPFGPPDGAQYPGGVEGSDGVERPCYRSGSIIDCENQILGERIPLIGVGQALEYRSDRTPARLGAQRVEVQLDPDLLPPDVVEVQIIIDVAGQHVEVYETPVPGHRFFWTWNGRNALGHPLDGTQIANVELRYAYRGVYREPDRSGRSFGEPSDGPIIGDAARELVALGAIRSIRVGTVDARRVGLGGLTIDAHHILDRSGRQLLLGDGRTVDLRGVASVAIGFATRAYHAYAGGYDCIDTSNLGRQVLEDALWGAATAGMGAFWDDIARGASSSARASAAGACRGGLCRRGGCFTAGTLVETEDGLRAIETIEAGERVLALDERTGEQGFYLVSHTTIRERQPVIALELMGDDETELVEATGEHPFWVRDHGWVEARHLERGDEVFTSRGGWIRIGGGTWLDREQTVYNLDVEDADTYFVGETGAWVHNLCPYDVSRFDDLASRSAVGDGLDLHHAGQAHVMEQLVPGYARSTGPAIALPRAEHAAIPNLRGATSLTPRQLLARDIRNLRRHTGAPNSSLQELIALHRSMYPGIF